MSSKLIPFGKYKGQPVEVLAQDEEYCRWLVGQDWFRTRFVGIHTLIVNNFGAPEETPEHNALQALFLDPAWRERFIAVRADYYCAVLVKQHAKLLRALRQMRSICLKDVEENVGWHREHAQAGIARIDGVLTELMVQFPIRFTSGVRFEVTGADVELGIQLFCWSKNLALPSVMGSDGYFVQCPPLWIGVPDELRIECKPVLGDDYPAVLRQMRSSKCNTLLVGNYTGIGATIEQLRGIFDGIWVCLMAEVDIARASFSGVMIGPESWVAS